MQDHMFLWWPSKNSSSLAGKLWFICHIHPTLNLHICTYLGLYKIPLIEKLSTPSKTIKGTWNNSLLKKINCFGRMQLWSCLKNTRRQWNKMVNTLFNGGPGENEKKCIFLLKNQRNFLDTTINILATSLKL